jgi:recombination protein RecA
VVKNKVAPPFREAQFDILYNEGISRLGDLIDLAVDQNVIVKAGSWFSYGEERIGQGRDAVKKYLQDNEPVAKKIEHQLRTKLGLVKSNGQPPAAGAAPPAPPAQAAGARAVPPPVAPPRPEPVRKK